MKSHLFLITVSSLSLMQFGQKRNYFLLFKEKLNGNDLNKTFHKSWEKIKTVQELICF
jgi:hypothetical protein